MVKSSLFRAILAGLALSCSGVDAFAASSVTDDDPGLHRRPLPPASGTIHLGPASEGPAVYELHRRWRRVAGRRRREIVDRTLYARPAVRYREAVLPDYGSGPQYGNGGYAIPPAGGLAVYSPGAYGPGPRIIMIPGR